MNNPDRRPTARVRERASEPSFCALRSRDGSRPRRPGSSLRLASAAALCMALANAAPAFAAQPATGIAAAGSANPRLPPCTNDPGGKTSLQGNLRIVHQSTQFASIVQFFRASDETDYYVGGLGSQTAAIEAQHVSDPTFMTDSLRRMQRLPALLTSAKFAVIDPGGRFECSGFVPGTYVLLGTLTVDTDHPSGRVHSYWRADVTISEPNRRRSYAVSGFRYIGEVVTP